MRHSASRSLSLKNKNAKKSAVCIYNRIIGPDGRFHWTCNYKAGDRGPFQAIILAAIMQGP